MLSVAGGGATAPDRLTSGRRAGTTSQAVRCATRALLNRDPLLLHERHAAVWRDATPGARYNGYLAALDARYFDLWSRYWHRLEQLRSADAPQEAEADLARDTFVWRRSAPDAVRQFVRGARARRRYRRLRTEWHTAATAG